MNPGALTSPYASSHRRLTRQVRWSVNASRGFPGALVDLGGIFRDPSFAGCRPLPRIRVGLQLRRERVIDAMRRAIVRAFGFAVCSMPSYDRALHALHECRTLVAMP